MNLLKDDVVEAEVKDLGISGEGVVYCDAYPIFVPLALPAERVRVRLDRVGKDFASGTLIEVLSPSKDRIKPACCYFGKCGGCDLQHMSKELQLFSKRQSIEKTLRRIGGISLAVPAVVSANEWACRNKLSLPFGTGGGGNVVLGFYEKYSHKVVPMKHCPLHGDWAAILISIVTDWANENGLCAYNENTGKGLLRHIVARNLDSLSVVLVVSDKHMPKLQELYKKINEKFTDCTLYLSQNDKNTNVILGDAPMLVFGEEKEQNFGRFSAVVSPSSFLQVNNAVRDLIYDAVAECLDGFDGNIVELYSGVGLLTAQLASRLQNSSIISVEIEPEAVFDALALMKKLGFENRVKCVLSDAGAFMKEYASSAKNSALILDPPRKGCDEIVLKSAVLSGFAKIIYISCNPATLARDLKILAPNYTITSLQPYDMFPQTSQK